MPIALPVLVLESVSARGPDLTRYFLVCVGLLLLVLGLAFLFRRFVAGGLRRRAAKRSLRVLDVLPLGGKQKLVVVRCYDRSFLLGLGDKDVCSIAELDTQELAPARPAGDRGEEERAASFGGNLTRALENPIDVRRPRRVERPAGWESGRGVVG